MSVILHRSLAILSYHSWEIAPEVLLDDIKTLRRRGWSAATIGECRDFIRGGRRDGKLFLVTSDDGSAKDEEFTEVLRHAGCPGVFFVNVGNMKNHRISFYRELLDKGDIAVEDHGYWHRKHLVSACVDGFVVPETYLGGLEHLRLTVGMPFCPTGSEVATPRFSPAPGVMEFAAEQAAHSDKMIGSHTWRQEIMNALAKNGFGCHRFGRFYLKGTFESAREYNRRVKHYLEEGRQAFSAMFGKKPEYFAYPWWQGSRKADALLLDLGYKGSFAGIGQCFGGKHSAFSIPRLPINGNTLRPITLDGVRKASCTNEFFASIKYHGKTLLGLR